MQKNVIEIDWKKMDKKHDQVTRTTASYQAGRLTNMGSTRRVSYGM